jgi:hypothetical protein
MMPGIMKIEAGSVSEDRRQRTEVKKFGAGRRKREVRGLRLASLPDVVRRY